MSSWLWGRQSFLEYSKVTNTREKVINGTTLNSVWHHQEDEKPSKRRYLQYIYSMKDSYSEHIRKKKTSYILARERPLDRKIGKRSE